MLGKIIGVAITVFGSLYVVAKILDKKINFKDYKLYLAIVVAITFLTVNIVLPYKTLGIILWIFLLAIINKFIFNCNMKQATVVSLLNQIIFIIAESLVLIVVTIFLNINQKQELIETFFNTIYANLFISIVAVLFTKIKLVKKIYKNLYSVIENSKFYIIFSTIGFFVFTLLVLFYFLYYSNNLTMLIFVCTLLTIVYFVVFTRSIFTHNSYLNMYVKYNNTLEALKSYEDILDKYKVSNHENKNQLLMIRNMLGKDSNGDVESYIDSLIDNNYKDDEKLMMETSKIPAGGLRALIYSKLLYMKNNNINFDLKIDRKIRSIQLIDLDSTLILDICKVIGVFLDNAIEESQKIKNNSVSIEIYIIDNKLNISIANVFEGYVDLDKIDAIKYTTKGTGHGYGLVLAKEIISQHSNLENIRMINDNIFIQILKIDLNKK